MSEDEEDDDESRVRDSLERPLLRELAELDLASFNIPIDDILDDFQRRFTDPQRAWTEKWPRDVVSLMVKGMPGLRLPGRC